MSDSEVVDIEHLRVVVFEDDDIWVAQCLEYDIGAQGPDVATLQKRFRIALLAELEVSLEKGDEPFSGIDPAPEFYHNLWDSCSGRFVPKEGTSIRSNRHAVELETALCA